MMIKEPVDFLKVVEDIKKNEQEQRKKAFKQIGDFYLELIEAGFTMEEAMAYMAALSKPPPSNEKK
jgi:hypothetical protein